MKKGLSKLIALSVLVVAFASCAKVPQAEIDSANAALESARQAGADRYVPATFNAANEAMKTGTAAVEEQNSKFVLFRNYDAPKATFDSVKTLASKGSYRNRCKKRTIKR